MNTSFGNLVKEETEAGTDSPGSSPVCRVPALGELLPGYIAGLLAESVAEEVEDHLLDCLECRSKHLKIVDIAEALRESAVNPPEPSGGAKILKMPALSDRRP